MCKLYYNCKFKIQYYNSYYIMKINYFRVKKVQLTLGRVY